MATRVDAKAAGTVEEGAQREGPDRGRSATRPARIPARGWWEAIKRVWAELGKDNVSLLAAGVAFYALLALAPALVAVVSVYGLVADPATVESQLSNVQGVLPASAYELVSSQLRRIVSTSSTSLSVGVIASLLFALWSANKGTTALISACNVAYDEPEERSIVRFYGLSLLLTLGAVAFVLVALAVVAVLPALFGSLGLGEVGRIALRVGRWPLLIGFVLVCLAVLYRYAPDREPPRWRWVSPGSLLASLVWVVASIGFSFYVANFGSYNETYGSLGAVVVLMLWLWITAYLVILGAELNAELERQTGEDTTRPPPKPRGQRGARVADELPA